MKLEKLIIKNFRVFKEEREITFSDLTAFVGCNDIGKSTILEALEIFFNNETVKIEKADISVYAEDGADIEISCCFSGFPEQLIIDSTASTSLDEEYLLNRNGFLEIKKVFTISSKTTEKVYIVCEHPSNENINDLMMLNITDLRRRASALGIETIDDLRVKADIRKAIRELVTPIILETKQVQVDKEGGKDVYESIKKYLPIYALFQTDRQSRDDDREVLDPLKVAIKEALQIMSDELEQINSQVRDKAMEIAEQTLGKLQEMDPELASILVPDFKTEPKYDSIYKLSISSDNGIPINKRGSGVRRLILLSFFRAEAERRMIDTNATSVIYAFEEPETSQHPDYQKLLVDALIDISESDNSQVILTTHTPALGGILPTWSLRFLHKNENGENVVSSGSDDILDRICNALGILPEPINVGAKGILLVEGPSDVFFYNHLSEKLCEGDHIDSSLKDKNIIVAPAGGVDTLKNWITRRIIDQFNIPWGIYIDSDIGTSKEEDRREMVNNLRVSGIKAYSTKKREGENYIHYDCLGIPEGEIVYEDTDDAKKIISQYCSIREAKVLDRYWPSMTTDQIRCVEKYSEIDGSERYEFTEALSDLLSIVNEE